MDGSVAENAMKYTKVELIMNSIKAYKYAKDIIKGRWKEGEKFINTHPAHRFMYARDVIKGKLPEDMHNNMVSRGIKNPENFYVKEYFKLLQRLTK